MQIISVQLLLLLPSLFQLSTTASKCDPGCTEWPESETLANVPFDVGPCCPKRSETDTQSCPIDPSTWDPTSGKCTSFCPLRVSYTFGRPVYILTKHKCSMDSMPCYLYENQTAIFKGPKLDQQLHDNINVYSAFSNDIASSFNWNGLIASHKGTLYETALEVDGPNYHTTVGGFWAFLPVQRTLCGTYTESLDKVASAKSCVQSMKQKTARDICVSQAVSDPVDSTKALGLTQLLPRYAYGEDGVSYMMVNEDAASEQYKQSVGYSSWLGFTQEVVKEFSKYESNNHGAEDGSGHQQSECSTDARTSPLFEDCLRAATDFYTPLYDGVTDLKQDSWEQGCTSTETWNNHNCVKMASYGTCDIRLGFVDGHKKQDAIDRVKDKDCKPHIFNLLGLLARLLQDCAGQGRVEGTIVLNNGKDHEKCENKLYLASSDS